MQPNFDRSTARRAQVIPPLLATVGFSGMLFLIHLGTRAASFGLEPPQASIVRDLLGLLLVVVALALPVGWTVTRWVPALEREAPERRFGPWLVAVRFIALWAVIAVSFVATVLDPRLTGSGTIVLWGAVAGLAAFGCWVACLGPHKVETPGRVFLQVAIDSMLLAVALHVSGGLLNPFASLFVFHAVLAGLLLPNGLAPRAIAVVAGVASILAFLEASGLLPASCLKGAESCLTADRLVIAAAGVAILTLTLGCGLLVASLMKAVRTERDALARTSLERGQEARELAAAQSSLSAVIECIADAVLFAGPDGKILLRNRAAAALWPGRAEGPANDLRVCHTESRWTQMLDRIVHAGELEHHPLLPIGGRMYEATYGRVSGAEGVSLGAVMVARDVTERLREEGLRAERERMATIGKLAAGLAHEINNPLGSIQLYTQHALKRVEGQEPLSDHLATVLRNANVCKKIVRDLLEYARQRPPEKRPVEAMELIELAFKTVRPKAAGASVELVGEAGLGVVVEVDVDQIVQVLVNLALNGIDAMADFAREASPAQRIESARAATPTQPIQSLSGRPRQLSMRVDARDREVAIIVEDTGPGIPENQRATIFSPFFTTKSEGTGLGLAVAKDIAHAHGGDVVLEAEAERGARFVLTLPRVKRNFGGEAKPTDRTEMP